CGHRSCATWARRWPAWLRLSGLALCQRPEALEQAERGLPWSLQLDHPFAGFGDELLDLVRQADRPAARAGEGVCETVLVADVEESLFAIGADRVAQSFEFEDRLLVPFDPAPYFALQARELLAGEPVSDTA